MRRRDDETPREATTHFFANLPVLELHELHTNKNPNKEDFVFGIVLKEAGIVKLFIIEVFTTI